MLTYILSQPRSGSTVLTAILDKRKGIVCMAESNFPQMLGVITKAERANKRWLAALYLGTRMAPDPIDIDEAEACMSGTDEEILVSLGKAVAAKLGRDPSDVSNVVWKTTRSIGLHQGPLATSGRFVALRRNSSNVFESQSRFIHGVNNRHPFRYALFSQSYEHALRRCPQDRTFQLNYDDLPGILPRLLDFMSVEDRGEWETHGSILDGVAKECDWLSQVTGEFRNTDPEKRARLDPAVKKRLTIALATASCLRPLMGPVRRHFDMRSIAYYKSVADSHYRPTAP
jgi:hypothetical protein